MLTSGNCSRRLFAVMLGMLSCFAGRCAGNTIDKSVLEANGLYSVLQYGAKGDAVHDDTAAFQQALDAAGKRGGTVLVPPVGPGKGYVLTKTVVVPQGTSLIGSIAGLSNNAWASFPLPDKNVVGAKIFARPSRDQYEQIRKQPLFVLNGGSTVRGFWILYDRQPWPTDQEFRNPKSPYYYKSFEEARARFVKEHVHPYGPTFYAQWPAVNIVLEDICCDRYYDFFFETQGGKSFISRVCAYGYKRAFVLKECLDVNRLTQIHCVPNVGPACPGVVGPDKSYTWIYGMSSLTGGQHRYTDRQIGWICAK